MYKNQRSYIIKIILNFAFIACSWNFLINTVSASKNNNKEDYTLLEENFSKDDDINVKGLYKHIHYTFKNETLLREALHPLLPARLQLPELKYQHLEFVGDAVLGLVIRERILALFPEQKRELHHKLYSSLTQNKTLAEVYSDNLRIEQYLPYPGRPTCKYCDVVEAVIGAVYNDSHDNGLSNSRKFIMRILDDHVLEQKWQEILEFQKSRPYESKDEIEKLLAKGSPVLPRIEAIIEDLFATQILHADSPKSNLNMILTSIWNDRPEYSSPSLGINEHERPVFIVAVTGAQIGRIIKGFGYTADSAEQDAARKAINFLAQKKFFHQKILDLHSQSFTKFVNEYCLVKQGALTSKQTVLSQPCPLFTFQVQRGKDIVSEGVGLTKKEAEEKAAQKACEYLIETGQVDRKFLDPSKQYRSMLREWRAQDKIPDVQFIPKEEKLVPAMYKFSVTVNGDVKGQGTGISTEEARENAYRAVFEQLLEKQQKDLEYKEELKVSAKRTNPAKPIVISRVSEVKEPGSEKEEPFSSQPVAKEKVYKEYRSSPRRDLPPPSLLLPKAKNTPGKKSKTESGSISTSQSPRKQNSNNSKTGSKQQGNQNTERDKEPNSRSWVVKAKPTGGNLPHLIGKKPGALEQEKNW